MIGETWGGPYWDATEITNSLPLLLWSHRLLFPTEPEEKRALLVVCDGNREVKPMVSRVSWKRTAIRRSRNHIKNRQAATSSWIPKAAACCKYKCATAIGSVGSRGCPRDLEQAHRSIPILRERERERER
ncbi:hypothetical protein VTK26DRAFT_7342 [Humicola hyalothermophila]